jgi:hypothetical protein
LHKIVKVILPCSVLLKPSAGLNREILPLFPFIRCFGKPTKPAKTSYKREQRKYHRTKEEKNRVDEEEFG